MPWPSISWSVSVLNPPMMCSARLTPATVTTPWWRPLWEPFSWPVAATNQCVSVDRSLPPLPPLPHSLPFLVKQVQERVHAAWRATLEQAQPSRGSAVGNIQLYLSRDRQAQAPGWVGSQSRAFEVQQCRGFQPLRAAPKVPACLPVLQDWHGNTL